MFSLGFNSGDVVRVLWTAVQSGVAAFWVAVQGVGPIGSVNGGKAAVVAGIVAAAAAFLSAVKNAVLSDSSSAK